MKRVLCLILINLATVPSIIAGGGWAQKKGDAYFKLSEWWIVFDKHYTDAGLTDPNITTGVFNTFLYAEYGLNDRFTGIFNASIFSRNYTNNLKSSITRNTLVEGDALNAFGDMDIGFKYRLNKIENKINSAISLTFGIPSGRTQGGDNQNLQTGDGEFNQIIQLDTGTGFNLFRKTPAYANIYFGFNNRSNDFSEEVRFGFELGVAILNERLWIVGKNNSIESLKNGATSEMINSMSIFANNTEYTSFALELNYFINDNLGISTGIATATRGEIIAAAPSYSAGIFLTINN